VRRVGARIIFGPDNAYLRDQFAGPLETGIASAVVDYAWDRVGDAPSGKIHQWYPGTTGSGRGVQQRLGGAAPGDNRGSKVSQHVSVRRARSLSAKLDFEHAARLALN
jgi:hypothetical protein